jgi:alpha-L-fucosidase 2
MLVQSHNGYIEFLPALPDTWSEGSFSGIKARGAFIVDLQWSESEWTKAEIYSAKGISCSIRSESGIRITSGNKNIRFKKSGQNIYTFSTEPGARYLVTPGQIKDN